MCTAFMNNTEKGPWNLTDSYVYICSTQMKYVSST